MLYDNDSTSISKQFSAAQDQRLNVVIVWLGNEIVAYLIQQLFKLCGRPPQYAPAQACKLTFDLLTLKVVSESHVTWATSVPILVFLGLSVLDLGPIYATDRRQTRIIAQCPYPS